MRDPPDLTDSAVDCRRFDGCKPVLGENDHRFASLNDTRDFLGSEGDRPTHLPGEFFRHAFCLAYQGAKKSADVLDPVTER